MATLDSLKQALRGQAIIASSPRQALSDTQYSVGFNTLLGDGGSEWKTYQDFIIPQLSQLLDPIFNSRPQISVLEIGPGPKSVFGYLPGHLRRKIRRYVAFEPNDVFSADLEEWLSSAPKTEFPLPCLGSPPAIHRRPFVLENNLGNDSSTGAHGINEQFDVVLFCHSMYGMKPKRSFIEQALEIIVGQPEGGMVVVFHRDGSLNLDGLVCCRTAPFPTGVARVANYDVVLDSFAPFIAGFVMQDEKEDKAMRIKWREVCRALGRRDEDHPDHLTFSSPNVMATFTRHATALPGLTAQMSLLSDKTVKNREARLHRPASVVRPTDIQHVQKCVLWALEHGVGLTIIGGGHGGQCLWPNVVAVDMGAFDQVHVLMTGAHGGGSESNVGSLVVAEAGCKTGDIVSKTMAAGVTVPLGSRPSVGAGLWLQGGIGHLARLHGLACDAIIGAVIVSVESGQVLCVGHVPNQHRPAGAISPKNEADLLWAIKGAGTNFGIVVSVTFKAYPAPTYLTRNWVIPLHNDTQARLRFSEYDNLARKLSRNCSADAYLYWDDGRLHLGVTMFESSTPALTVGRPAPRPIDVDWGSEESSKVVDSVGLFEAEMYMSLMHGGHASGKTSAFKRCLFLKGISAVDVADRLVAAINERPSPLCYFHLLHGGGAVGDIPADASAFGCRDWDFACVITGVWPRDQDGTDEARAAARWVYNTVAELLPLSSGAYGADLGPDPRDDALAVRAFGPNRLRLAHFKRSLDPHNILAYACPLPEKPVPPKLILVITGESGVGKDYCATNVWAPMFNTCAPGFPNTRVISISDAIKREYAAATGLDFNRLLQDRAYKEQHRKALTAFFQDQLQQRPRLPQEHFLNVVHGAIGVDVLLITGMRDEAPVAKFSYLVPGSRLLEVRVQVSEETHQVRLGCRGDEKDQSSKNGKPMSNTLDYRPCLVWNNDTPGHEAAKEFAERYLLPFCDESLQRLANMVRPIPDFPRSGIEFRHVLNIVQHPGGLALSTSLLKARFNGDWSKVGAIACCEAGGFVYASALALRVDVPLVLIREAGKLPPPTVSAVKSPSHISSSAPNGGRGKKIEVERDVVPRGASIVVVDDVLATGETLCAVLQLLNQVDVILDDVNIMVVAEFPIHHGRDLLRRRGFGRIKIQSLLVLDGA